MGYSQVTLMRRYLTSISTCLTFMWIAVYFSSSAMANVNYDVSLGDGLISPAVMSGKVNEIVILHVTNAGTKPHNLVIKDFFIFSHDLNPGEDLTLSFTPEKTGTFTYHSDRGGKPEPGMTGRLLIK